LGLNAWHSVSNSHLGQERNNSIAAAPLAPASVTSLIAAIEIGAAIGTLSNNLGLDCQVAAIVGVRLVEGELYHFLATSNSKSLNDCGEVGNQVAGNGDSALALVGSNIGLGNAQAKAAVLAHYSALWIELDASDGSALEALEHLGGINHLRVSALAIEPEAIEWQVLIGLGAVAHGELVLIGAKAAQCNLKGASLATVDSHSAIELAKLGGSELHGNHHCLAAGKSSSLVGCAIGSSKCNGGGDGLSATVLNGNIHHLVHANVELAKVKALGANLSGIVNLFLCVGESGLRQEVIGSVAREGSVVSLALAQERAALVGSTLGHLALKHQVAALVGERRVKNNLHLGAASLGSCNLGGHNGETSDTNGIDKSILVGNAKRNLALAAAEEHASVVEIELHAGDLRAFQVTNQGSGIDSLRLGCSVVPPQRVDRNISVGSRSIADGKGLLSTNRHHTGSNYCQRK